MCSFLSRVVLGVGIATAVLGLPDPRISSAQPGPRASSSADVDTRAAARKLVEEGIAAQEAKDYDRAIDLFTRAFSLIPHPDLLFNIAQSHRLAGRPDRAEPFYDRYLALAPDGEQSAAARAVLAKIRGATATGRLKLSSTPEGLIVVLDGARIGVTPIERNLAVGAHRIVLLDGERPVGERTVEIPAGVTTDVSMLVVPSVGDGPEHPTRPSKVVPTLLWAAGGLALAGSGIAFYLGQKGGPEHPEDPYIYRGATTTGFVLAGVGAAAIGAGVWFWIRGSRESAPVAIISPDGRSFGWSGRF